MHVPPARAPLALVAAALLLTFAGCGGDSTRPETPGDMALATGGSQTGVVGEKLAQAIGVKVTTSAGKALAGVTVSFAPAASGGSLSAGSATTNASGIASVVWTLGTRSGADIDTLRASVSELPEKELTITASATAGVPASLLAISGDAQTGDPGESVAEPLVVAVRDAFDNPNEGIVVS